MREIDRDLIRGEHYGQRSCEPHKQAEHMAAPTKSATWRFFLPTRSRPHMAQSGHPSRAQPCPLLGVKRTSQIKAAMSAFDPKRTLRFTIAAVQLSPEPHFVSRKSLL